MTLYRVFIFNMSLSPLFLILGGTRFSSARMVHSFIEPPAQDNCDYYLADDGKCPKYFTR